MIDFLWHSQEGVKKIDDWVVRPGVAMATKMRNLTRILKSYKSMTANDIESNYQNDKQKIKIRSKKFDCFQMENALFLQSGRGKTVHQTVCLRCQRRWFVLLGHRV